MKKNIIFFLAIQLFIFLFTPSIFAQFRSLHTKNLRLVFYDETLAPYTARCFENAFKFHSNLFDYTATEKVTIFLQDFRDFGYGSAITVPRNSITIGVAPFSYDYETITANERINWMMNHEVAHIVTMDKASGTDTFFRSLFLGKVTPNAEDPLSMVYSHLTSPRWSSPRWFIEGIAVFLETWMAGGLGRALSAYDEMVFRTMVHDNDYFYDIIGLESEGTAIDFQVGANSYLYGTRFLSYLAYHYGLEKLLQWYNRTEESYGYFSSQFQNVYGVSLLEEWSRWIEWEHQWQQANLDSIALYPTTNYHPFSHKILGSVSRAYYDPLHNKLYVAVRYPGEIAHIAAIDVKTGTLKKICDVKGATLFSVTSMAYDQNTSTLFYTTDNNNWRDLKSINVNSGKSKLLMRDVRTGDLVFNQADRSIWGVRHDNGISTLVRIPHPYNEWKQVYSFPYGKDIFDLDISPDGKLITGALAEADGTQYLIKMDTGKLLKGNMSYDILYDFDISTPANFTFSPNGRNLFGSSYYSGVSNIYRYDLEAQDIVILSNCESGFFRPVPISDDSLIVFRYTSKGFVPVLIPNQPLEKVKHVTFLGNEIVKKHPVVKSFVVGPPSSVNIDSLTIFSGPYSPIKNIRLNSVYPIVEGYKDFASFGARLDFSDLIGLTGLNANLSYSPNTHLPQKERIHAKINFHYWYWEIFSTYNNADFYDLFGPTKTSRKGYSLGFKYKKTYVYNIPKIIDLSIFGTGYTGIETLPYYQNVPSLFDKSLSFGAKFNYSYLSKSLGAIDEEKGFRWQLTSHNNYVNKEFIPQLFTNMDYGLLLPIGHSSIWLRSYFGYSFGDRDEPFANFFFGAFGNNWIDHLEIKRFREFNSFPGVEINEIGGINYGKLMVEWALPPLRFRRYGFTSLYLRWTQLTLFTSSIVTNFDNNHYRRSLLNIGGQLDFRLITFSYLKSTLSLGYAVAFEQDQKAATEFMISFKIL